MKLAIQSVADKGNPEKERLILKVSADTDIGDYVLIQAEFHNGSVHTNVYNTYWFPDKKIETDDTVVLYTKTGRDSDKESGSRKRVHFFYWGVSDPIWSMEDRAPVLLHAPEWISKNPTDL